ncbi:MAG: hypothetical protein ACKOXQ_02040 [Hydrogenophaga sp.]
MLTPALMQRNKAGPAADLSAKGATASSDLTHAQKLPENAAAAFIGTQKNGPFDIAGEVARAWLTLPLGDA